VTPLGWVFMLSSVSFVLGLTTFCFYRVLVSHVEPPEDDNAPGREDERSPSEGVG
jgi:hypothetical protein